MNLLETLLNAQDGAVVRQLASKFQLDEGQAKSAMGALIPALGKGLGQNAGSAQGLDGLIGALSRGQHGRYLDEPEALARPEAVDEGNGILGHIFGSKDVSRQVASQAAERSGVDSGILKQMLPMLASAAMGALSKQGLGGGAAASGMNALSGGKGGGIGEMLTGFLDADKDGSAVDDILGMASKFLR
jgi:hypothetical protein